MNLISPQKARDLLRSYPLKAGKSELKKALTCLFPQDEPCVITTVDGLQLYLKNYRHNARIFWWFEEVEPALQYYVRALLPAAAHVLDVGAASGIIGLSAARLKGAQVKLVEANPDVQASLRQTLRINPELSTLCQLYDQPCALGPVDSRFESQSGITIEKIIHDAGWDHVDFLKVDVDGPDFEVLSSAGSCLRPDFIEAIYIETEIARPADILKVVGMGYAPYATKRTHLPELRRLGTNESEKTYYQALDLKAMTDKNVPSNVLFLDQKSPLNQHMSRWCA